MLAARPRTVEAEINYLGPMDSMPYFYARDHDARQSRAGAAPGRDRRRPPGHAPAEPRSRGLSARPAPQRGRGLRGCGADRDDLRRRGRGADPGATGADHVVARGTVLRFSKQQNRDAYVNSLPAGFVHVDVSRESFADFAARNLEGHPDRDALLAGRYVGLNIWRSSRRRRRTCRSPCAPPIR